MKESQCHHICTMILLVGLMNATSLTCIIILGILSISESGLAWLYGKIEKHEATLAELNAKKGTP